jgi:putative alpha-1,2-mannosidase
VGSPLFNKATLRLPSGKQVVIRTNNNSPSNVYIKQLKLNGKKYEHNYLEIETLKKGARLVFDMDALPDKTRGTKAEDAPYSMSE